MIHFRSFLVALFIFSSLCLMEAMVKAKVSLDSLLTQVQVDEFRQANDISFPEITPDSMSIKIAVIDFGLARVADRTDVFSKVIKNPNRKPASVDKNYLGHGIHVAGIIKGLNPQVEIVGIDFDPNLANFSQEVYKAINEGVKIINISGGGARFSKKEYQAIQAAKDKGILVVTSAGNYKQNLSYKKNKYYPSSYNLSNIVSVGALTKKRTRLEDSNFGDAVDFFAPGHDIKSLSPACKGLCSTQSGTSMAAPYVTALAAYVWMQNPNMTYQEVIVELNQMANNRKFFY